MQLSKLPFLLFLALWLVLLGSSTVTAAPRATTVLILPDGAESVDLLLSNAADSLRGENIGITEFDDATLAGFELEAALECLKDEAAEDCSDVLNMVPAEWVLLMRVQRVSDDPDSDQKVVGKLYSAETADLLQVEQRICKRCSSSERLSSLIRELVAEIATKQLAAKAPDTFLDVQSYPAGAVLSIDGAVVGPTGQSYRVTPGEHRIAVRHKGHRLASQTVTVAANEHKALSVTLDPKPKPDGTRRLLGWLSLGAGGFALAGGTVQLLRHEGAPPAGEPRDPERLDTKTQGIVGLAAGAALVGVGTALILTADSSEDRDSDGLSLGATPTTSGLSLVVGGHF